MFESLGEMLGAWNIRTDERVKLQHVYIIIAIGLLLAAGIIGLINHGLGQNILAVAIMSAIVYLINAVVWSLIQSAVLSRLPRRNSRKSK